MMIRNLITALATTFLSVAALAECPAGQVLKCTTTQKWVCAPTPEYVSEYQYVVDPATGEGSYQYVCSWQQVCGWQSEESCVCVDKLSFMNEG